jgi:glycerol-3-phosphate dehydrogenase
VDDARLVVLNAKMPPRPRAQVRTRTRGTEGPARGRPVADRGRGTRRSTPALVNAAGPRVLDLLGLLGEAPDYAMRLVRGSHIVVPRLFDHAYSPTSSSCRRADLLRHPL